MNFSKTIKNIKNTDVLVVGGGISGSMAAIAAAQNGASVICIDRFSFPGGNLGPGNIGGAPNLELPPYLDKLKGVPGEFIDRCEEYVGGTLFSSYFRDSNTMVYVLLNMFNEAGVDFIGSTQFIEAIVEDGKVKGAIATNKSGLLAINAKTVIDCTGDADVAISAGVKELDPHPPGYGGLYFAIGNVDMDVYRNTLYGSRASEEDIQWAKDNFFFKGARSYNIIHHEKILKYLRKAWENDEFKFVWDVKDFGRIFNDHNLFYGSSGVQRIVDPENIAEYGIVGGLIGVQGMRNHESGDIEVMNGLEQSIRRYIYEYAQFLKKNVPGFEKSYLHFTSPYFSARAGRSATMEYTITMKDVEEKSRFDDSVFLAGKGLFVEVELDITGAEGPYEMPYRQLLPVGADNLLVAGRSAITMPPETRARFMILLMGQAAGVAAAVAAKDNVDVRNVDLNKVRSILYNKYDAYYGDDARIKELNIK